MAIKQETSGYRRWAEVQVFEGKTREGEQIGRQGFRNTLTGKLVVPEKGWNGEPPADEHGDLACVISASDKYRKGYEAIKWHTETVNADK